MDSITLVLTYACNQNCSYCYQKRDALKMDFNTARKTIDYFSESGNSDSVINFYGGEPFLEFELMKQIIPYGLKRFKRKGTHLKYSVTTNGSLIDKQRLAYCSKNGVDIYLSIDGDQKVHESSRGSHSFSSVERVLSIYKDFPDVPLKIQMVITPNNAKHLLQSVHYLVSAGVSSLFMNFCYDQKWDKEGIETLRYQYRKANNYLLKVKAEGNKIHFKERKPPDPLKPLFRCDAGQDRFAITPDGFIYGCSMHIPWSKRAHEMGSSHHLSDLCLGHIDELSGSKLMKRLDRLSMDTRFLGQYFYYTSKTKCQECEYFNQCDICPVYSMIFNQDHLLVPDWICEIKKVEHQIQ